MYGMKALQRGLNIANEKEKQMDKLEYTSNDIANLIKLRPDFAMALENVVLKRMVEELSGTKVTAIGKYKNG